MSQQESLSAAVSLFLKNILSTYFWVGFQSRDGHRFVLASHGIAYYQTQSNHQIPFTSGHTREQGPRHTFDADSTLHLGSNYQSENYQYCVFY